MSSALSWQHCSLPPSWRQSELHPLCWDEIFHAHNICFQIHPAPEPPSVLAMLSATLASALTSQRRDRQCLCCAGHSFPSSFACHPRSPGECKICMGLPHRPAADWRASAGLLPCEPGDLPRTTHTLGAPSQPLQPSPLEERRAASSLLSTPRRLHLRTSPESS